MDTPIHHALQYGSLCLCPCVAPEVFKAASMAAPVGWAFSQAWAWLAAGTWHDICDANSGRSNCGLRQTGERAVSAAIALTFWPNHFDQQVHAAHAFGAPPRLLSRRLPAITALLDGSTAEIFRPKSPGHRFYTTPMLTMPGNTRDHGANMLAASRSERDREHHANNQSRRRKRVRNDADAGGADANAIMDAELKRGRQRRAAFSHELHQIETKEAQFQHLKELRQKRQSYARRSGNFCRKDGTALETPTPRLPRKQLRIKGDKTDAQVSLLELTIERQGLLPPSKIKCRPDETPEAIKARIGTWIGLWHMDRLSASDVLCLTRTGELCCRRRFRLRRRACETVIH